MPPHIISLRSVLFSRGQTPPTGVCVPYAKEGPGEMSELTRNSIIDPVFVSGPVDWCSASDSASRAQQPRTPEVQSSAPSPHPRCPLRFRWMTCSKDPLVLETLEDLSNK